VLELERIHAIPVALGRSVELVAKAEEFIAVAPLLRFEGEWIS
jgi:hypothetical protein